jgi:hypothetical protein
MRLYLRCNDIDKLSYDSNDFQTKLTQNIDTINGSCNVFRSKMTFKNINLNNIFSQIELKNKKTFNIKIVSINNINESDQNIIDTTSPPQLRNSNLYISGLNFLNNKNENLISQFTNFNPNDELIFDVHFHRGDLLPSFTHFYDNRFANTSEWIRYALDNINSINPSDSIFRYKMICPTQVPLLNNKIMKGVMTKYPWNISESLYTINVVDDGSFVSLVPEVNQFIQIQILPDVNKWFNKQFTNDIEQDVNNIELTCLMPTSPCINLEFQLRDILTDVLQPVISEPNNKVFPSLQIVLDIY